MFYATRIQSVGNGVAVDTSGKTLTFIGYLPVKAGDTVFTDGNVIFGNAPPKGDDAIFDERSGIPVLGDEYSLSTSDPKDELRGYFNKSGKFKEYEIKGDEWIVNDKKIYAHDDDESDDESKIIDAEIAEDGELYTVEKVIDETEDPQYTDKYCCITEHSDNFVVYTIYENPIANWYTATKKYFSLAMSFEQADFDKRDETVNKDCKLVICKNGVQYQVIKFTDWLKEYEDLAIEYVSVNVPEHVPTDHINSRAILRNFKIKPDGSYEAVIIFEIWAERDFLEMLYHTNWIMCESKHETNEEPVEGDNPIWGIIRKEEFKITDRVVDVLNTEPQTSGPEEDDPFRSTAAHLISMVKLSSKEDNKILAKSLHLYPLQLFEGGLELSTGASTLKTTAENDFPYQYAHGGTETHLDGEYIETSYYSQSALIYSTVTDTRKTYYIWRLEIRWDSRYMPDAPDYDNPEEEIADNFTFPVQDEYNATIKNVGEDIDLWKFGGVYDKKNNQVVKEFSTRKNDAHKWNMSLVPLKGDNYLFGVRKDEDQKVDGALYKISKDGTFEQVADGLKNFRLRELKQINKAKK